MSNSFDYQLILDNWSVIKEQQKADFLEHMYKCDARHNKSHPMHGLYTGLWKNFCIKEAGPYARDRYFELLQAVDEYEQTLKTVQPAT